MSNESFLETNGKFHCKCGVEHSRGPINGFDVFRCLSCGNSCTPVWLSQHNWHPDKEIDQEVQADCMEGIIAEAEAKIFSERVNSAWRKHADAHFIIR